MQHITMGMPQYCGSQSQSPYSSAIFPMQRSTFVHGLPLSRLPTSSIGICKKTQKSDTQQERPTDRLDNCHCCCNGHGCPTTGMLCVCATHIHCDLCGSLFHANNADSIGQLLQPKWSAVTLHWLCMCAYLEEMQTQERKRVCSIKHGIHPQRHHHQEPPTVAAC